MGGESEKAAITIPLDLADVCVLKTERGEGGGYRITVESTLATTKCRRCGREIDQFVGHDDWIELRHLPILDRPVTIRLRPKRYRCPHCPGGPTTTQQVEWYTPRSPLTCAYERYLLLRMVNATVDDVCVKERVSYDTMLGVIDRYIDRRVDWVEWERLGVLGIDEIALKKGHRDFAAIVTTRTSDGEVSVLGVLPDRKKETVRAFLRGMPHRLKETVTTVCTDLWDGYIQAVKEVLPQAKVVADRFHVAKAYREAADALRKTEMKRLKKELPEAEYQAIQKVMWPFRKRPEELNPEEAERLTRLFGYAPALKQAYDLREALTDLFDQPLSKEEGRRAIEAWQEQVRTSGLTCFDSFLTTLGNWIEEITNYFLDRQTSGFVEGLNNKIKVLKRRCYGIYNLSHLFQRLSLDLHGYRRFAPAYSQ